MLSLHLKKATAVLLCLVMLLGTIPVASAAEDIGVVVSAPSAGLGWLFIYWCSVPDVEFYAYSVRNITTGDLLVDREQTSDTSGSACDDFVAGHTYRVWAGACCTGNDPSNTSTWDYTGQATVTVIGCAHNDTDVAWDTNYAITYTPVSDTKHEMSGYMYEYCTDCLERVGASYQMAKKYEHNYDRNGDCPDCGYTADCPHDRTKLVVRDGYPAYKQDDEEQHIVDIQYERVCRDCDDVVEYAVDSARDYYREAHDYDSKGVCVYCGYVQTEKQEPLCVDVYTAQSNAEVGATISAFAYAEGGTGEYDYAWLVTCDGYTVAETDFSYGSSYSVTANVEGTYYFTVYVQDGNGHQTSASCASVVTAATCPHTNRDVAWDTSYGITYTPISDTEHTMSGYMYEYCTECVERVSSSYEMTKAYAHNFDAAGDCPSCGYTHACTHESTYFVPRDGYPSYSPYNEENHIYDVQYSEYCSNPDCGKMVNYMADSARVYEHLPHSFGADGTCYYCGYVQPEKQEPLCVDVYADQSNANVGDVINASAVITGGSGDYSIAWKVTMNGGILYETDLSMGTMYSYRADQMGTYVFTATVVDSAGNSLTVSSAGIEVKVAHNWITVSSAEIINQSATHHEIVTTTYKECTICGDKTETVVDRQSVEHVIARTSYEADHPHQKFNVCRDCPAHPLIAGQYYTVDGRSTPQDADHCCLCHGHVWMTADAYEVDGQWRENCANCELYRTTEAPEPEHTHSFSVNVTSAATHPHQVSGYCECGEFTDFLDVYAKHMNCCQCVGHNWENSFYNGYAVRQCLVCGERHEEKTPESEAMQEYRELLKATQTEANEYKEQYDVDEYASALWRVIALQATHKLTDEWFVFGVQYTDALQSAGATVKDWAVDPVVPQDDYTDQQIELWKTLIVEMLTDHEVSGSTQEKEFADTASLILGTTWDIANEAGLGNGVKNMKHDLKLNREDIQYLEKMVTDLSAKFDHLADTTLGTNPNYAKDFELMYQTKGKIDELQKNLDSLKEGVGTDKVAVAIAESMPWLLTGFSAVAEGGNAVNQMKAMREAYEELASNESVYANNVEALIAIISDAEAMNNITLKAAAENVLEQINTEYAERNLGILKELKDFSESTGTFIADFGGEMVDGASDILFDKLIDKLGGSYMGIVSIGATAVDVATNHKEVYESAEMLMALGTMSSGMNLFAAADNASGTDYSYQLWAELQAKGCEQAIDFISQYKDDGWFQVTIDELGIPAEDRQTVYNRLNEEKQEYLRFSDQRIGK